MARSAEDTEDEAAAHVVAGSMYSQTLSRGIAVLELLARTGTPHGAADLALHLDVHRAVAHRLIRTLEAHHLLRAKSEGQYVLGYGVAELCTGVAPDLQVAARPVLADLAEQTSATTFLAVVDGADLLTLLQVEPHRPGPRVVYGQGLRLPLTSGSPGIAILAGRPRQAGERAAVTRARRDGYSRSAGELHASTIGVSAAVRSPSGAVDAVLSVVFLKGQEWDEPVVAKLVTTSAADISTARR